MLKREGGWGGGRYRLQNATFALNGPEYSYFSFFLCFRTSLTRSSIIGRAVYKSSLNGLTPSSYHQLLYSYLNPNSHKTTQSKQSVLQYLWEKRTRVWPGKYLRSIIDILLCPKRIHPIHIKTRTTLRLHNPLKQSKPISLPRRRLQQQTPQKTTRKFRRKNIQVQRTGRQFSYLARMVQVQCLVLCLVISPTLEMPGVPV